MDATDTRILRHLMEDGRKSNPEIADDIGVSEETVRKRRVGLLSDGAYETVAVPDFKRLGYGVELLIGMHVEPSRIWEVAEEVAEIDEVYRVLITTGTFEIFVWVMTDSLAETVITVRRSISSIAGVIRLTTFMCLDKKKPWTATGP